MARFRCICLAALLAGSSTQCLLYTDPINVKPEVTITDAAPASIKRGQTFTYAARAHDGDQETSSLKLAWYEGDACPKDLRAAQADEVLGTEPTWDFPGRDTLGDFCVWVVVTDEHGARAFDARAGRVDNQPPVAKVAVLAPAEAVGGTGAASVALFSQVRVSGAGSTDPDDDPLTYTWRILLPDNSTAQPDPCPTPKASDVCYLVRAPGKHRFELVVRDGVDSTQPLVQEVMVRPDAPPCVRLTAPSFLVSTLPREASKDFSFRVQTVEDDGDPVPPRPGTTSDSTFYWYVRVNQGPFQRFGSFEPQLTIPANTYTLGDLVQVRLEYYDRVKSRHIGCGDQELFCPSGPPSADTCYQRVGWTVVMR